MRARPGVVGLPDVEEAHVRHVLDQFWDIRIKGNAGISALDVTAKGSVSADPAVSILDELDAEALLFAIGSGESRLSLLEGCWF